MGFSRIEIQTHDAIQEMSAAVIRFQRLAELDYLRNALDDEALGEALNTPRDLSPEQKQMMKERMDRLYTLLWPPRVH